MEVLHILKLIVTLVREHINAGLIKTSSKVFYVQFFLGFTTNYEPSLAINHDFEIFFLCLLARLCWNFGADVKHIHESLISSQCFARVSVQVFILISTWSSVRSSQHKRTTEERRIYYYYSKLMEEWVRVRRLCVCVLCIINCTIKLLHLPTSDCRRSELP